MAHTGYKPEYCQMLIDHMSKGYSFESFGADANCGMDTLREWARLYEDFHKAKKTGQEKARKFWEALHILKSSGQKTSQLDSKQMDMSGIIFGLKTRFRDVYGEHVTVEMKPLEIAEEMTPFQLKSLHALIGQRIHAIASADFKEVKQNKEDTEDQKENDPCLPTT